MAGFLRDNCIEPQGAGFEPGPEFPDDVREQLLSLEGGRELLCLCDEVRLLKPENDRVIKAAKNLPQLFYHILATKNEQSLAPLKRCLNEMNFFLRTCIGPEACAQEYKGQP